MKVTELNKDELLELKQRYYAETGSFPDGSPSYEELAEIDEIVDDEEIYEEYAGVDFVKDDFFCNSSRGGNE